MNTPSPSILLIYTGGTIGMIENPETGALENFHWEQFQQHVPELKRFNFHIDSIMFGPPIDSSDMEPKYWVRIAQIISKEYDRYDGFVILHGTDTMAYTASALSFLLENLTKPVILTGSQLPLGQLRTDGKENILTSIELASTYHRDGTPVVPEVCIYFNGHLLRGNRSTKKNADGFNAFDSFNYPHLCDAGVNFTFHEHHILHPDYSRPMVAHHKMDRNVIIFSLFPGIEEHIVKHVLEAPELRGIIMRSFGSGNAPHYPWIIRALKEASERGVVVVNISQCVAGCVEMSRYDTGIQLLDAGIISGRDSTVEAAATKLMFLQAQYQDADKIRQLMAHPIAGEFTENL